MFRAFCLVSLVATAACAFEDSERCRKGFVFEDHTCNKEDTSSADTGQDDTGQDDAGQDDAGASGDLSGLGEPCPETGSPECASNGFDADYCAGQPGKTGYCTMQGCSQTPNDCPKGYVCCDLPYEGVPNFCTTQADYDAMGGAAACENS